jgi:hypothetical protein
VRVVSMAKSMSRMAFARSFKVIAVGSLMDVLRRLA